jgi:hypothetical protein
MKNLEEKFGKKFFLEHFGLNYLYKPKFFDEFEEMMSLDILDSMLSKTNIWNNKNFIMMLDQKKLNYGDYSSISLETKNCRRSSKSYKWKMPGKPLFFYGKSSSFWTSF